MPEVTALRCNAPVLPGGAIQALHPLTASTVRLTGGVWADWQRDNGSTSIPHQLHWLEHDGTIDNLRRLGPRGPEMGPRRGLWFTDSDLYKALEGIAWEIGRGDLDDAQTEGLRAILADLTGVVGEAQDPDGYINSFIQAGEGDRWALLEQSHELYCIGHLIQAGIAANRATGERSLLDIALRAADLVIDVSDTAQGLGLDGHEEIEMALVELFRETRDARYLQLARRLVDDRGHGTIDAGTASSDYFQDGTPIREQTEVVGHAVRAVYLLCGAVDVATETGDATLLAAVERQWASMTARKTYVTGALGSRFEGEAFGDDYELPADRGYGETCATIGNIMLSWRLLLATGHGKYADAIERSLYNLFAASTDVARTGYFYNNPAQRRIPLPASDPLVRPPRADAPGTRPPWFECACCPPNILRTVASLSSYFATGDTAGVQVHQFAPSTISTANGVELRVATRYPEDGRITVEVVQTPATAWTLSLRIPAWAADESTVTINGKPITLAATDGYAPLSRSWQAGDRIDLDLPVRPRWTVAHPAADGLRGTVALERGPVVYALESVDLDTDVDLNTVMVDVDAPVRELTGDVAGIPTLLLETRGSSGAPGWDHAGFRGLEAVRNDPAPSPLQFRFIPYALWANRGPSTMRVHVPVHLA